MLAVPVVQRREMSKKGRSSLGDPTARALPYMAAAAIALVLSLSAITQRVALIPIAVALIAAMFLYARWWVDRRLARFDALARELVASPTTARAAIDRAVSAQQNARLFDSPFWRVAMLDAWRAGAFDRYAVFAEAAASSAALRSEPSGSLRRNAVAELAFARALRGDVAACRDAIGAWSRDATDDEPERDGREVVTVASALLLLHEGRINEAKDTVATVLPALSRAVPEAREVAVAMLGAQPATQRTADGDRSDAPESSSALDAALARAFAAVKLCPIDAPSREGRASPTLEFDANTVPIELPSPVRSRVDPIEYTPVPSAVGIVSLVCSALLDLPLFAVLAFAMGVIVLVLVLLDRRRAAEDRAATKRALSKLALSSDGAAATDDKATLERIAASSTAELAGWACLLRCRIAWDEGDLRGALAWAEQCLARLHDATELRGSVAAHRIEAAQRASLCLAGLGRGADAERYARLFAASPQLARAQLAAIRLIGATRDDRSDPKRAEEVTGYAALAARVANAPEVQLLANLVLSVGDPAREEAYRAVLQRWAKGRAWIEAVAPSWAARILAPVRVALDGPTASDSEIDERGPRRDEDSVRQSG